MIGRHTIPSLRRQFRWRLAILQAIILSIIVTTLVMILILAGEYHPGEPADEVIAVVRDASTRQQNGELALRSTPALEKLRVEMPGLWFIVRDRAGHRLSEGSVPPEFASIGASLDGVSQARLGWNIADPPRPGARMQWVGSAIGEVQIVTGPGAQVSWDRALGAGLLAAFASLLPMLAIMILATWLATPVVIRSALGGLNEVIEEAGRIDVDQHGLRLPLATVPQEVRPLVDAINMTLERLDDGHERHRRFLANAAHELRTPIAVLTTRLGLLPLGSSRSTLLEDVGRLATLAEQLLDLERLRRDWRADMSEVDLVALVRDVAADLAPVAINAGYTLAVETAIERIEVMGDRASLERALVNLVQNAIQHGGRRGAILLRVDMSGGIEVHDQGTGIAEQDRTRAFEPFCRLGAGATGAGLGLYLVAEVVALHGGHIVALDAPLGGLRMRIELPVSVPGSCKPPVIQRA